MLFAPRYWNFHNNLCTWNSLSPSAFLSRFVLSRRSFLTDNGCLFGQGQHHQEFFHSCTIFVNRLIGALLFQPTATCSPVLHLLTASPLKTPVCSDFQLEILYAAFLVFTSHQPSYHLVLHALYHGIFRPQLFTYLATIYLVRGFESHNF
ncbi:hypothetical protein V6Z11_A06G211600 [Gossypium hirsutum]